jgi:phytoene synthase
MREASASARRLDQALPHCRAVLRRRARTFSLASAFLPPRERRDAAVVYAWCRRADDAVDGGGDAAAALDQVRRGLAHVYAGEPLEDPVLAAFQDVVERHRIPRAYPDGLLAGMAADLGRVRYATLGGLLEYAFRAAGTVGLMMAQVMDVRDVCALAPAARLGMAMQLTNVCRDVAEDWAMGRLYLPRDVLAEAGGAWIADVEGPLPAAARVPLARATRRLLAEADRYYRGGQAGLPALPWRCALAVRAASSLYAAIGAEIAGRGHDVLAGRAVVGRAAKARLVAGALAGAAREAGGRLRRGAAPPRLPAVVRFADVVLA